MFVPTSYPLWDASVRLGTLRTQWVFTTWVRFGAASRSSRNVYLLRSVFVADRSGFHWDTSIHPTWLRVGQSLSCLKVRYALSFCFRKSQLEELCLYRRACRFKADRRQMLRCTLEKTADKGRSCKRSPQKPVL